MELAYTVGHTKSYDQYLMESPKPIKLGRSDNYPGGWIWRTIEDARAFLTRPDLEETYSDMDRRKFSVYEVELPTSWEVDVNQILDERGVHHLINSAIVLRKVS